MPPRTVKRGAGSAGTKKTSPRRAAKAQKEEAIEAEVSPAPTVAEVKEDLKVEQEGGDVVIEEKHVDVDPSTDAISDQNGFKKQEKAKDSIDDYEKDERLELEDEPDYEPEEYVGVDYDEKEIEQEEPLEAEDEGEEDPEDNMGDEEGDMAEEEMEDVHEELEGEEYEQEQEHGHELELEQEHEHENAHVQKQAHEHEHEHEHTQVVDAEEEEHHEVVNERRKRKEFEVFVGGLDKDANEAALRKAFGVVGEVTEVRLMMNAQTKKNKGFAFLRFATVDQAKRAVRELKHAVINGKQCGVTPSQDNDTLFLGNICKTWSKDALMEKLKQYGVDNVEDLTVVEDTNNVGMNRGFAFLEFSSRSDAMDAFKRLQKKDIMFGVERPAKVSFADSFIDPGDEIMAQVKTIFVDGLPASWKEEYVKQLLKDYGEIEKIELARNMPSAKRKNFGFITFKTHENALTCANCINNEEIGEGDNKAKLRARLSRPLQRGKGKHVGRGDYRSPRGDGRAIRGSRGRPTPARSLPVRGLRGVGSHIPSASVRRSAVALRDRRPVVSSYPARSRPLPPPARSYDRRPPVPTYPKSSFRREYSRHDDLPPPRSRAVADYGSRAVPERRPYRDEYSTRGPTYIDPQRSTSRSTARRAFVDDGYGQRFERHPPPPPLPPSYHRDSRAREYDSLSGSKRPYSALDDVPPRYADAGIRQSRARLDYDYGSGSSQYVDGYSDRVGRSSLGYGSSRTSQDSHGLYSSRQSMGYGGGSYGGSDVGGMYSSSYDDEYMSRGSDIGSSYSSMYSGRGVGGSSYMGSGGSGSYY